MNDFTLPDTSIAMIEDWGIFCDWKLPTKSDWDLIRAVNFSDVVIGVKERNFTDTIFNPVFSTKRIIASVSPRQRQSCNIHLMVWAARSLSWIDRTIARVVELAAKIRACSIVLDAEEQYVYSFDSVLDKISPEDAALRIRQLFDEAKQKYGNPDLKLITASYPKPPSSVIPLIGYSDFAIPMAYSFWAPKKYNVENPHFSHTGVTFPGVMQAEAYNAYTKYIYPERVIMGLGNYNGKRPKRSFRPAVSHIQSMRWSAAEAAGLGVESFWWWSLKHLKAKTSRGEETRCFFGVENYYT